MFETNILGKTHSNSKTHIAEGNGVAFCLGEAQTKTLNQIEFRWSENVGKVRR